MHPIWRAIAGFILRGRIPILIVIGVLTAFMWSVRGTEVDQAFAKVVPDDDPEYLKYLDFKEEFGEDGNIVVLGTDDNIFKREVFNDLFDLVEALKKVEGVQDVISPTHLSTLVRNDSTESFDLTRITPQKVSTQVAADQVRTTIGNLPFYEGLIMDSVTQTYLVAISIKQKTLDSKDKVTVYNAILALTEPFEKKHGLDFKYAGLPALRVNVHKTVIGELVLFLVLALVVMMITLLIFFRSIYTVILPLAVVSIVIVWSVGILGLLEYKITLITGLIPALVTVIGIPNSVYLITKYHIEFKRTQNKVKSLIRVIERIGVVTVMTNATTAVGFGVLAFTDIRMLKEFGTVSGLAVIAAFFISLLLLPIFFSFLPPPSRSQVKHLDRKILHTFIGFLDRVVHRHRWAVYVTAIGATVFSIWGMSLLVPNAYMADDIPQETELITDLRYMEDRFGGVLPFEVMIDTKKKRGATKRSNLKKVSELQAKLSTYNAISRTVSIADFIKSVRQSFFEGTRDDYVIPGKSEFNFIKLYLSKTNTTENNFTKTLTDSTLQKIRVTGNIRDIGSIHTKALVDSIQQDIDAVFAPDKYDAFITGTTKIYIRANDYLIQNLLQSLAIAFFVIAILMGILFRSWRMVFISLIPNFLPLMMVSGLMGVAGIPLKPSTALVFSVAFGIAVDDSIHFLARYRLAKSLGDTVPEAITNSFKDTGVSMIYTSIILFFGFVIFTASSFGGTFALGILTSTTLLIAMFSNLLLLPALLLVFDRKNPPKGSRPIEPRVLLEA